MNDGMPQWQLAELGSKAGELLGMPLDLTWDSSGVRLGTEGDGVYMHEPYNRQGRIEITGWHPGCTYSFRGDGRRSISVRADRGPGVIAAEIQARLLPGYRETVIKIREHNEAEAAETQAREHLAGLICGLFPAGVTSMPSHCQSSGRSEVIVRLPGYQGGEVKLSSNGGEVQFDRFRVPAAVALRMLEIASILTDTETRAAS